MREIGDIINYFFRLMRTFFIEVVMPFIFVVGISSIVWFSVTLVNYSNTKDQKRQDFKECVDMTHSAVWCYDKIR